MENNKIQRRFDEFRNRDYVKTAVLGLCLIAAGIVIILNNMGILAYSVRRIVVSWQMLLVVLGIVGLGRKNYSGGIILLLVGIFFLVPMFPGLHLGASFTKNFWPALLVVCGILMIAKTGNGSNHLHIRYTDGGDYPQDENPKHHSRAYDTYSEDGYINQKFVFTGSEQVFTGPVFKGGSIEVVFGGTNLDLRNANLPDDQDAYLRIKGTFGGVCIQLPPDWRVEVRNTSFLGGVTDARPRGVARTSSRKLILDIECAFGGGEIR